MTSTGLSSMVRLPFAAIMRLAVIIGGLLAQRFPAVAGVALQYQRPVGVEAQRVTEIGAGRVQFERRDLVVVHRDRARAFPRHRSRRETALPRRRPGRRRRARTFRLKRCVSARVTAAWPIQICWLAQPSCCAPGRDRLTKQRPLRAIGGAAAVGEVGRHVPPLDAEIRMRAVIGGKRESLAGNDRRKSFARSRRARQSLARSALARRARASSAPPAKARRDDRDPIAHWQRS